MCRLVIEGANFHDIPGFYTEINRVFMADESWQLGPSLDAFNDLLHGGFGAMRGGGPVTLIWRDFDKKPRRSGPCCDARLSDGQDRPARPVQRSQVSGRS